MPITKTRLETETVVLWNDAEPDAWVTTSSMTTKRRLEKKGYVFKELAPDCGTWRAEVPKRLCLPRAIKAKTTRNTGFARVKQAS